MFDRVLEISKRWDDLPVGPWRVVQVRDWYAVCDSHGRPLLETRDAALARSIAASYEDVAYLCGEVRRLRREAKERDENSSDFVGKGHDGRITLATYRIEDAEDDATG